MNWLREIEDAQSVDAVVELVNEFVQQQPQYFWTRVPQESRPAGVATDEELHAWHHRIVQALVKSKNATIELQDLCVLFLRASVRAHQIELRNGESNKPSNDDAGYSAARKPRIGSA